MTIAIALLQPSAHPAPRTSFPKKNRGHFPVRNGSSQRYLKKNWVSPLKEKEALSQSGGFDKYLRMLLSDCRSPNVTFYRNASDNHVCLLCFCHIETARLNCSTVTPQIRLTFQWFRHNNTKHGFSCLLETRCIRLMK